MFTFLRVNEFGIEHRAKLTLQRFVSASAVGTLLSNHRASWIILELLGGIGYGGVDD